MQNLWEKRSLALIIDFIVITLITWILSALIYPLIAIAGGFAVFNYWLLASAIIILVYFTYLEENHGKTLGKNLMKIKVIADEGEITYQKALLRNLSKILWIPLVVDILAGYIAGDSKIRYLDKVAGTDVIFTGVENKGKPESSSKPEGTV